MRGPDNAVEVVQLAANEAVASLPTSAGRVLGPVLTAATAGAPSAATLAPALSEAFNGGERFAVVQPAEGDDSVVAAVRTQTSPGYFDAERMGRQAAAFEAAGMKPTQAASVAAAQQGIALYQGDESGQLEKLPTE